MLLQPLKRLSRIFPYARRVQDGLEAMRTHIVNLERDLADAKARLDNSRNLSGMDGGPGTATVDQDTASQIFAVHSVDAAWSDTAGVFLNGWIHVGPHSVRKVALVCGDHRAETLALTSRLDVASHYPGLPPEGAAGFSLYLPCSGHLPLVLAATTDAGVHEAPVQLSPRTDPEWPDATGASERFVGAMLGRRGTVLELGARVVGSLTQSWRARFEPGCRYLGNDIHPGPGIDVVGDVHSLTAHVAPGSLDGVFSVAVLEHLVAPWLAAAEINRSLKPGGETLHVTHQTWPLHETPNDYFRMSDQALRSLFGPAHGFEVIECGMAYPVAIVPPTYMRHSAWLQVPLGRGYGQSYIHARKVEELDPKSAFWGVHDLERLSKAYPRPTG